MPKTIAQRFWPKVAVKEAGACWLWTAAVNNMGYGMIQHNGNMRKATHIALELSGRQRPAAPNNLALHADGCVSRACCNPAHLRWGSSADNVHDAIRLGRQKPPTAKGEKHGQSRITAKLVREIRRTTLSDAYWARKAGVEPSTIRRARIGETWAHIR